MIKKIDINSQEFINELALTQSFTDRVCNEYNLVNNLDEDINDSIRQGLTRNKMIYGRRFCPCFMVIGNTQEEQDKEDNRLCPCTPALEVEIPKNGHCHCGIFCTPEFIEKKKAQEAADEVSHLHSRGLSKQECDLILQKAQIDGSELEALLEAREEGTVKFNLVDTREWMEWVNGRIKGTDYLIPTTSFYQSLSQIENQKDIPTIVYCVSGSRSDYCRNVMKDLGFKSVSNVAYGLMNFSGEMISGEEGI